MLYTGIDLIEIARIERAIARWGERFLQRVYTPAELAAYRARIPSLAVRWAGKEAAAKLLGLGLRGLGGAANKPGDAAAWIDFEILSDAQGRPQIYLHGRAAAHARALHISELAISLSHTREHAIASVCALALPPA